MARKHEGYARNIVESVPRGSGQEQIIEHVATMLESFARDCEIVGARNARERMLREQLAIARGLQQDANARVLIIEQELRAMGKEF